MKLSVRFFAILRERAGTGEMEQELPDGASVGDLWAQLCAVLPRLKEHGGCVSFAVNREYVEATHGLSDGDEVALIPPVSGG